MIGHGAGAILNYFHSELRSHWGRAFRFEKSLERARELGERITRVSDLFAQIVLMLEDLARAAERGIYDFATIISGLPSLPAAMAEMPQCYIALGFAAPPETEEEIKAQYRRLAKALHPDVGGDAEAFRVLQDNYAACLEEIKK